MISTISIYTTGLEKFSNNSNELLDELISRILLLYPDSSTVNPENFLNNFHYHISHSSLNDERVRILSSLNNNEFASKLIYKYTKSLMKDLVGPDIVIQKNVGLSIQLPGDASSLLPIHSDVLSSDCSPYELCYGYH